MSVFNEAYSTVQTVEGTVLDRIELANTLAENLTALATDTINSLSNIDLNIDAGDLPSPPTLTFDPNLDIVLPEITPQVFGTVSPIFPNRIELEDAGSIREVNIDEFRPSVRALTIPAPPTLARIDKPIKPTFNYDVQFPVAPNIVLPQDPKLVEISVPNFSGLQIPVFDPKEPEFTGTPISKAFNWAEPKYESEILDEVFDKVRLLWSGGLGLPIEIEEAIVSRAKEREDVLVRQAISEADIDYSGRGFTSAVGEHARRVDTLRQDALLKKQSSNRELAIEFARIQVENVKFAIQQGIAAEQVLVNIFLNVAARSFEAAKFQIQSQLEIYNAQVALFNAKMNALQIKSEVFKAKLQAELSKIEVFKAEIEAEIAKGTINEQKVKTYTARIQAISAQTEIYKSETSAAAIKIDAVKAKIEAYKAEISAYATEVDADKNRFEAYKSQIQGEVAKAGIVEAESRAYTALIQGKSTLVNVDKARADIVLDRNRIRLQEFTANIEKGRAQLAAQTASIDATARAYLADTQRFTAVAQAETAKAQLGVSAEESKMRSNVAFYQAKVQAHISSMEQMIREAQVSVDALKAAGSLSGTLAAGAMAGVHVGATLSGSGSVAAQGSRSLNETENTTYSENRNYNYEGS